jgi:hypothetical protein
LEVVDWQAIRNSQLAISGQHSAADGGLQQKDASEAEMDIGPCRAIEWNVWFSEKNLRLIYAQTPAVVIVSVIGKGEGVRLFAPTSRRSESSTPIYLLWQIGAENPPISRMIFVEWNQRVAEISAGWGA